MAKYRSGANDKPFVVGLVSLVASRNLSAPHPDLSGVDPLGCVPYFMSVICCGISLSHIYIKQS